MNKFAKKIKLQTSRIMRVTEEWDVTNLLQVLLQEINSKKPCSYTQKTFVLMKMSRRRLEYVFRLRLQKTRSRRLDQDEYSRLTHTTSRRLQDVFKTSSRHLQDMLPRSLQDVFKTSSRRLAKASSRHLQVVFQKSLQDIFKMYHQVKLFA